MAAGLSACVAALSVTACEVGASDGSDAYNRPDSGSLADGWSTNPGESPTGTTLLPKAPAPPVQTRGGVITTPGGYTVVDEVCGAFAGAKDLAAQREVFKAPLFRAFVVAGPFAYAADGSNLWTFALSDPTAPTPTAIQPLDGAPIALAVVDEALYVATVDGLTRHTLAADGTPGAATAVALESDAPVLDVALATRPDGSRALLLARGSAGVTVLSLDANGAPAAGAQEEAGLGVANAITVDGARVGVAACSEVRLYDLGDDALTLVQRLPMPYGAAKSVALDGTRVYVGAGLAMLAIESGPVPKLLGHYADPVVGFYVNDVVARDGAVYIAAGDQSVRVVRVSSGLSAGVPFSWDAPDTSIQSPAKLPTPTLASEAYIVQRDPLALTLQGNLLYALGNFRYRGRRTIEVFDVAQPPGYLLPVGRWEQPVTLSDGRRVGQRTLLSGPGGAWLAGDDTATSATRASPAAIGATAAWEQTAYLALRAGGLLSVDAGASTPKALGEGHTQANALAADDQRLYVASPEDDAILVATREPPALEGALILDDSFLGEAALAVVGDRLLAYDRITGLLATYVTSVPGLPVRAGLVWVGPCEAYDYADTFNGSRQAEARFVTQGDQAFLLCPAPVDGDRARLLAVDATGPAVLHTRELPAGIATHLAASDTQLAALLWDPARLETRLVVLSLDLGSDAEPQQTLFTGHGAALVHGNGWIVGDAFWSRVWRYDDALQPLGAQELAP